MAPREWAAARVVAQAKTSGGGGVDLPTLAITAAASATAAYVTSKIWAPGTLGAAATTPVLIALLKEAYAKPTQAVTRAVPVRGVVRSAGAGEPAQPRAPGESSTRPGDLPAPAQERVPQPGEVSGRSRPPRHAWKMAVVTGLLGFLIAAVIITVPEVVAGKSAAGGGRQTTLFGGEERESETETETTTTRDSEREPSRGGDTVTVPPADTVTVPPATTTVPPSETPGETTTPEPSETVPEPPEP